MLHDPCDSMTHLHKRSLLPLLPRIYISRIPVYPSTHLSICLYLCIYTSPLAVCLSTYLATYLSASTRGLLPYDTYDTSMIHILCPSSLPPFLSYRPGNLAASLPLCLSASLPLCPSASLPLCLSASLPLCLSVYSGK
jgi:hypothetical protein